MTHNLVKRVALAVAVAALATPAAQAGTTSYDGYKSSYPQLHQVLSGAVSVPGSTEYDGYKSSYPQLHELSLSGGPDLKSSYPQLHELSLSGGADYKSSYPQLHQVLSGAVRTPTAVATGNSGIDWNDAGLGALIGAFAAGLLGSVALRVRRSRLAAL